MMNPDASPPADAEVAGVGEISFTFSGKQMLSDGVLGTMVSHRRNFLVCEKKESIPADEAEKYVCFQSSNTDKHFALGKVCGKTNKYAQFNRFRNHIKIDHVDLRVDESGPDRFEVEYRLETVARSAGVHEHMAAIQMASYLLRVRAEKRKREEEERKEDEEEDGKKEKGGDQEDASGQFDFTEPQLSGEEEEEQGAEEKEAEVDNETEEVELDENTEENEELSDADDEEEGEGIAEPMRKKGRGRFVGCVYCLQGFLGLRDLQDHLWTFHDAATLWHCDECELFLSSKQKLMQHMDTQKHKSKLEEKEECKEEEEKQEEDVDQEDVSVDVEVRSNMLYVCLFVC